MRFERVKARFQALLLASIVGAQSMAQAAQLVPPPAGADWTDRWGGDKGQAYSTLDQITAANVGRLGLAWSLDLPDERRGLEATPVAVDGMLYFTGSLSRVYAVDARSGRLSWSYDPEVWNDPDEHMQYIFGVNRGVAYAHGKIFVGTLDGRLIALNAQSGKLVWSVDTSNGETRTTITGAPLAFGDKVIIGQGGGDQGMRGYVTAYDANTGKQAWRFFITPGTPEENAKDPILAMAAKTWDGEYWKTGTGGGAWNGFTYDPDLNQVYIGTGNGGPWNVNVRSPGTGDNLFLCSIVALNADTGQYIWHYQVNPRESWDYKATANMSLATLTINGKPRRVLMQAPTNGFFYVLDRTNGELLSAEKIGKATWAEKIDLATGRPVEIPGLRFENGPIAFWPSPWGVHNFHTMAYSPRTRLAYIPTMQAGAVFAPIPGSGWLDLRVGLDDPNDGKGWLLAWDPVQQKERWRVQHETLLNGGVAVTAGDVVFQGTAGGWFNAYDARTGKRLWSFDAKLGIVASPMTFRAGKQQYVSILVGYGGGVEAKFGNDRGWKYGAQPRRLLTFKLDGTAQLPPTPPPDHSIRAVDDPALTIDAVAAKSGEPLFGAHCAMCHGGSLQASGGNAPDLRESRLALSFEAFRSVVQQGILAPRGMPKYGQLSDADLHKIFMYIRAGARSAVAEPTATPSDTSGLR